MSRPESLFTLAATLISAVFLTACVFLLPDIARAGEFEIGGPLLADEAGGEEAAPSSKPCTCPESQKRSGRPKFAGLSDALDEGDEIAALESVQSALSKVGDGASYVWHRSNGRLSGLVQPTASFRNTSGQVCRHLVILLTTGDRTSKAEGVACRAADGLWRLEG